MARRPRTRLATRTTVLPGAATPAAKATVLQEATTLVVAAATAATVLCRATTLEAGATAAATTTKAATAVGTSSRGLPAQ